MRPLPAVAALLLLVPFASAEDGLRQLRKADVQIAIGIGDYHRDRRHNDHGRMPRYPDHRRHDDREGMGDRGRELAMQQCTKARWDDDRNSCMSAARAAEYFDPQAVPGCGNMQWGSAIGKCLSAIANKEYLPTEIQICSNNRWDDDKISCFSNGGRPYRGHERRRPRYDPRPDLDSYILHKLRSIKSDLDRGNIARAIADIADLLVFVEEGMSGRHR